MTGAGSRGRGLRRSRRIEHGDELLDISRGRMAAGNEADSRAWRASGASRGPRTRGLLRRGVFLRLVRTHVSDRSFLLRRPGRAEVRNRPGEMVLVIWLVLITPWNVAINRPEPIVPG